MCKKNTLYGFLLIFFFVLSCLAYFINLGFRLSVDILVPLLMLVGMSVTVFFSVLRFKSILNPVTLLMPLMIGFIYYSFMISNKQTRLDSETQFAIWGFFISFIMGVFVKFKKSHSLKSGYFNNVCSNYKYIIILHFFGVLVFLYEMYINGGFPFIQTVFYKADVYASMDYVPVLHYFVMLHAIIIPVLYYFYKTNLLSKYKYYILSGVSIFILMNLLSRQIMIFSALSFFLVYVKLNNKSINKYSLYFAIFFAVFFLVFGNLRYQAIAKNISSDSELLYMKNYSDVDVTKNINMFDVSYNLYVTQNFSTLNSMIVDSDNYLMYGANTFKPIVKIFQVDKAIGFEYLDKFDTVSRLATIIGDIYLDFGILGIIFIPFLYGVFSVYSYSRYVCSDSLGSMILWSIVSYVLLMSVFANYFNLLFIWICFIFCYLIDRRVKFS